MRPSANGQQPPSARAPFHIRFPTNHGNLDQDEEWFEFDLDGQTRRLRIHDYADIYRVPGLYEALVYGKLRCNSPRRMAELLENVLSGWLEDPTGLRVLDLGAGNGIVAEELHRLGVETIVGLDLLPEAALAARRDRPGIYADYVVADLCDLGPRERRQLETIHFNCLVTVAALGFGDIPPEAFTTAFNLISKEGWLGMTIKEDFLRPAGDDTGFARLIRELIHRRIVDIQSQIRFCHRLSIDGEQLFYTAIVARKTDHIPQSVLNKITDDTEIGRPEAATLLGHT